jgi:hypothetical protein
MKGNNINIKYLGEIPPFLSLGNVIKLTNGKLLYMNEF